MLQNFCVIYAFRDDKYQICISVVTAHFFDAHSTFFAMSRVFHRKVLYSILKEAAS
jgi:hypothetical protein